MTKFSFNNTKNTNIGHILFKFNCKFYLQVLFKEDIDLRLRSCSTSKLAKELKKQIEIYYQNLLHIWKLQKKIYNKGVKSHSYATSKKVWLNSKYIKTKQNKKL